MKINNMKVSFIMLLFAMCFMINVLFCSAYYQYEIVDKTTAIETWAISESTVANVDGDDTVFLKAACPNRKDLVNENITNNICSVLMAAAIPEGINLHLYIMILFFYLTLFIVLPDEWTLINQKVRLDN